MTPVSSPPLVVHLVAHTHWDREWYLPAGRFRQRLVALIDELLDESQAASEPFLLDGQAVVLDDYLAVRPDRRAALAARLANGSLEAGPWYVLADELIPSAEALVRNLLIGRATVRALGAEPPAALYSPDAFGHPAMLPVLAAGFGCAAIVLWRGYGGPAWPPGDTVRWCAPDGTVALLYHLPPDGYEFGASLPVDAAAAAERWARIRDVLAPRASLGVTLLLNGADHHARQPNLARAAEALARAAFPARVRRSTLRAFVEDLERRARAAPLPTVSGELRASYGYTWTLQGTFGTRAHQKRRNARVERLLVRDVEPWAALVRRLGGRTRAPLLAAAWKALLLCHPHDTLCGCSIDDVARAMDARLDDAEAQARGLREDALLDLVGHDRVRARLTPEAWRPVVIVRNRAARPRGGVAELLVARFRQHVPVGPGSGTVTSTPRPPVPFSLAQGSVPMQVLHDDVRHERTESPIHYPDDDLVDVARVVAWIPPVPAYGTTALTIDDVTDARPVVPEPVRVGDLWMDNGILHVAVDASGAVRLDALEQETSIFSLVAFEDVGDVGDLYTPSPRPPVMRPGVFVGMHVSHAGPLRGELTMVWRLDVPVETTRRGRSTVTEPLLVNVALTLDAGARALALRVWGENRCRDHRLRLVLATGLADAEVWADAAFGPVRREPIVPPPACTEDTPPTAPLARYVTLATPERGVTIYSDGLAEYEAMRTGQVAITLVRAVGELSRNDLRERPGHAGWPSPTPGAQSLGPFEACFAVFPHGPRTPETIDLIERVSDDVLLPLAGVTLRSALAVPPDVAGVALEGEGLAFSACTESTDGAWTVLRCVNLTDRVVEGRWHCGFPVLEAYLARLDETPVEPARHAGHTVELTAGPRAVVTILVR